MSNPKNPLGKYFLTDQARNNRSNFNAGYKNRFSLDYGYLVPAGIWDIPSNSHFELDMQAVLSSNPTLAPVLGTMKFRAEAYYIEKAAYVDLLRNNEQVPLDRNVPFPTFNVNELRNYSTSFFSPQSGIFEFLQMFPAGWSNNMFGGDDQNDSVPPLNAIPLIMYYDIYRNYYCNPQDDNIPIRVKSYSQDSNITDYFVTRSDIAEFVRNARLNPSHIARYFDRFMGQNMPILVSPISPNQWPRAIDHEVYRHYGLMRRTLNNDFFTSFMSNENVELMSTYTSNIAVDGGQFNIMQIVQANRDWRFATRSLLWGTDWKDYNKIHYGVDLRIPYGKPQFLGALVNNVTFQDVISQTQAGAQNAPATNNTNLGSRAGLAYGALKNHKGKFVEFNSRDECYVMVLISIVPDVDYYQGIDPMYFKTNLSHSWAVEYNSLGMQDFHRGWASAVLSRQNEGSPEPWTSYNDSIWKVPIWFEYMAKYNQLHGQFTQDFQNRYWTFARPFTALVDLFGRQFEDTVSGDYYNNLSTYVLPEMYNYIFANTLGEDNFQVQVRFDARLNNMLDKNVIAYL